MAFIDEKGRIGGRVHWFDCLLGVAILILVLRSVFLAWPRFDREVTETIRFEVVVSGLTFDLAESIAIGQWVKDRTSGEFMGKIIAKTTAPESARPSRTFGEFDRSALATIQDLLLVLERSGTLIEREGIYFGRETIRSGQERIFHTFYTEFTGKINRIVVVKE